ncbi:uncharacterized protein [Argopecten irradians]|uniref:uncharacterized protein n=1 Tax=Argopecten irradians TaxID=31199 RepID=UPI003724656B
MAAVYVTLHIISGYILFTEIRAEQYCYYSYTDHASSQQEGTLFCPTSCCGTVQDRTCCSSVTATVVGIVVCSTILLVSLVIIVLCCCYKASKTTIQRIHVPSEFGTSLECISRPESQYTCISSPPAIHPHSDEYLPPIQDDTESIPSYNPPPYSLHEIKEREGHVL